MNLNGRKGASAGRKKIRARIPWRVVDTRPGFHVTFLATNPQWRVLIVLYIIHRHRPWGVKPNRNPEINF